MKNILQNKTHLIIGFCLMLNFIFTNSINANHDSLGCVEPSACNYDPQAIIDDGSCDYGEVNCPDPCNTIYGCTDFNALNFLSIANCDDGECIYTDYGCMTTNACNYDPDATVDDGSCDYGIVDCPDPCNAIFGCTDPNACNFDPTANCDDDSCNFFSCLVDIKLDLIVNLDEVDEGEQVTFSIIVINTGPGPATGVEVTNQLPTGLTYVSHNAPYGNYDPSTGIWNVNELVIDQEETLTITVIVSEGTFTNVAEVTATNEKDIDSTPNNDEITEDDRDNATVSGTSHIHCAISTACNYNPDATSNEDCYFATPDCPDPCDAVLGCTDPFASNFNPLANCDNGGCIYDEGCTDPTACNYNPTAMLDNGTCEFGEINCLLPCSTIYGCIDPNACNFDPNANCDDTSCRFICLPDLWLDLNHLPNEVAPGSQVSIVIFVANETLTKTSATGIEITNILPAGLSYVSHEVSSGNYNPSTGIWSIDELSERQDGYLLIDVIVSEGTFAFVAEVTAMNESDVDSTPNNNDILEDDQVNITIIGNPDINSASIGDYVWLDTDDDGIQDADELPLGNIEITLRDEDGDLVGTEITDNEGFYDFTQLIAGNYTVSVGDGPPGFNLTTTDLYTINLNQGEDYNDADFGFLDGGLPGCTSPSACNYNPDAVIDNGTCNFGVGGCPDPCNAIIGCPGPEAANYNPLANCDDGSCIYYIEGCTNPNACNYNPNATLDNGTCDFGVTGCPDPCNAIVGCMNPELANYDPSANCETPDLDCLLGSTTIGGYVWFDINENGVQDEGESPIGGVTVTLTYPSGNTDTEITNGAGFYDFIALSADTYIVTVGAGPEGTVLTTLGSYNISVTLFQDYNDAIFGFSYVSDPGCTDPLACNYDPDATIDVGLCAYGNTECPNPCNVIIGCTDPDASNFNPNANCDDGSCQNDDTSDASCDNTDIINEFPWLNDLIDFDNCAGTSINFYNFGDYQFVEIDGDGNNKLYFQDGSLYCEDYDGFSCAANYCLHVQASTWDCCGTNEEEEETNTEVCHAVSTYPWIADVMDIENCDNGFIKVYDFGHYAFIEISDGNNNQLYLDDGRLWCTDGLGLDCADAYGLTDDQISTECNCGNTVGENNENLDEIFEQYSWLLTFIDPNDCSTEQISEYESFGQRYLYIETEECNALYAEDGSVFCIEYEDFNCLDFYNLSNPINNWSCSSNRLENNSSLSTIDFKIYPNPNNGYFEISTPALKEGIYLINIYSLDGALIQSKSLESGAESENIPIDLHNAPTGVYQVEILNNFEKITKKVVKY